MKRIGFFLVCLSLISCAVKHKITTMPVIGGEKGLELQAASFSDLADFEKDNILEISDAFEQSCLAVAEKPALLQTAKIYINPEVYLKLCEQFTSNRPQTDADMRHFLMNNFQPYRVLFNLNPRGKFTSYYEAELKASKYRHGAYQHPIYGRPNDLLEINLKDFAADLPDRRLLGRREKGKIVPYYTRAEIERYGVDAPVILWGDDPVDIYLMQIQGSAVALLDDGSRVRIRYADNNGHTFIGIGSILLKKGLLKPGEASMDKIRDWMKANPDVAKINMVENPRFIFHRISEAKGPIGALGVPLTAGRSLAVDPVYIPLGSLLWLETLAPDNTSLHKLVAAQDIGGAIKGAVRGDYFWGYGEEALVYAGKMNASGQYYILLPRQTKVEIRD